MAVLENFVFFNNTKTEGVSNILSTNTTDKVDDSYLYGIDGEFTIG